MCEKVKKILKKRLKKMKEHKDWLRWKAGFEPNNQIYDIYYNTPLDEKLVYFTCRDGADFTGNILRIAQELSKTEYGDLKFCMWVRDKEKWPEFERLRVRYGIKPIRMILEENDAVKAMEIAKYLVSDSGIPWKYVKREGQVFLNTWHGTPLKVMGKSVADERAVIGNVIHHFLSNDYLLYPSTYMRDIMLRDYMVANIMSGKVLMGGYPRNSVFFDTSRREQLRTELGYDGKNVYAYLPTHRGNRTHSKNDEQLEAVLQYLEELDAKLKEDQLLLVKLHIYNQSRIDFSSYKHITAFPVGYETYDVLNATDCLITDYSSVFFDYANSQKKIILFAYDQEEYFEDRGTYFPLADLPFPIVETIPELLKEMNSPKEYDDAAFLRKFCPYDEVDATEKLCRHVFKGEPVYEEIRPGNGKENILIYGGALAKNGITSALLRLLNSLDLSERNYYVAFRSQELRKNLERISALPQGVDYLPLMNGLELTFSEQDCYDSFKNEAETPSEFPELLKRAFRRNIDRYYYGVRFSRVIQFDGYVADVQLLFMMMDTHRTIFVHNDMMKEIQTKANQNANALRMAYRSYDCVACVSTDIMSAALQLSGREDNMRVIHNIQGFEEVREKGEWSIELQKDTELVCADPAGIEGVLSSSGIKIITVGRFSPEKGHERLLHAFDRFCEDHPDTKLIIIGGLGKLWGDTKKWRKQLKHWSNVTLIKGINNPHAITSRCDLFVLTSDYEGQPLVLTEADALGLCCFTTNTTGSRGFMEPHGGYMVENTEDGILQGMYDYVAGKIKPMQVDYKAWNEQALKEFYSLFENGETDAPVCKQACPK